MENVKIKKAAIKDDLFLVGEYTEELPGHSKKDSKFNCTAPIHDDLKNAFSNLRGHLAVLCDEVKAPKKNLDDLTDEALKTFTARGFSVGGSDENEGVTISGSKDGKYGIVNLNTPFQKYSKDEYPFISELASDIEACVYEVEEYLFNGKRAPEKQLEMDFGDDEGNGVGSEKFAEEGI